MKSHPGKISKIKSSVENYNWKEIDFPSQKKDWEKFEKNSKTIALNILYVTHNTEEVKHA